MLDKILEDSRYVLKNAKHVRIDTEKINQVSKKIFKIENTNWLELVPNGIFKLRSEELINLLIIIDSTCFSFFGEPKWKIKSGNIELDGSFAHTHAIYNYYIKTKNLDFTKVSLEEFKEIYKGNVDIPLLTERYEIIKQVSNIIKEKMNGNLYNYIKDIHEDKTLFELIVKNFPSFKDERVYNGKRVRLYKLAQLLTSDILYVLKEKENIKVDYSNLKGCSDYKIPQILRAMGIIKYSDELSKIVDNKVSILENSEYEVEIRASQIMAIEYIKQKLNNKYCSIEINDYLWAYSKKNNIALKPYHLTRTTSY